MKEQEYDDFVEDDEDDREPDYYVCYGCGHTQVRSPGGWGCPYCMAHMEPEYF